MKPFVAGFGIIVLVIGGVLLLNQNMIAGFGLAGLGILAIILALIAPASSGGASGQTLVTGETPEYDPLIVPNVGPAPFDPVVTNEPGVTRETPGGPPHVPESY